MRERRHSIPLPLGDEIPFSKGLMARALVVTGLDPERAYLVARYADRDLAERGAVSLDLDRLGELAAELIGEEAAERTVRRLRRLDALARLEEPLLLLVGGATGTGKSTIATEVAHRLGITRVTSTDFIRQTMRTFFSREFMPSVHYSSFEARLALTRAEEEESGDAAILGFLDQTRNVLVGVTPRSNARRRSGGRLCSRACTSSPAWSEATTRAPSSSRVSSRSRTRTCTEAISGCATRRPKACARSRSTSTRSRRSARSRTTCRARAPPRRPGDHNDSLDSAIGDVLDLVLRRADQLVAVG